MAGKLKPKRKRAPPVVRVTHVSPLARLVKSGALNVYEHTAADEIIAAYQMSQGLPVSRDAALGIPFGDPRPDAADDGAAKRSDILTGYRKWCNDLVGTVWVSVARAVLFDEYEPSKIDALRRQRKGTARGQFIVALRHFAALRGNMPRGAREWKLTVAPR